MTPDAEYFTSIYMYTDDYRPLFISIGLQWVV